VTRCLPGSRQRGTGQFSPRHRRSQGAFPACLTLLERGGSVRHGRRVSPLPRPLLWIWGSLLQPLPSRASPPPPLIPLPASKSRCSLSCRAASVLQRSQDFGLGKNRSCQACRGL